MMASRGPFALHWGPTLPSLWGMRMVLASKVHHTLTAAPFLGTQYVHFTDPQEHKSVGKAVGFVKPCHNNLYNLGQVLLTLGVS